MLDVAMQLDNLLAGVNLQDISEAHQNNLRDVVWQLLEKNGPEMTIEAVRQAVDVDLVWIKSLPAGKQTALLHVVLQDNKKVFVVAPGGGSVKLCAQPKGSKDSKAKGAADGSSAVAHPVAGPATSLALPPEKGVTKTVVVVEGQTPEDVASHLAATSATTLHGTALMCVAIRSTADWGDQSDDALLKFVRDVVPSEWKVPASGVVRRDDDAAAALVCFCSEQYEFKHLANDHGIMVCFHEREAEKPSRNLPPSVSLVISNKEGLDDLDALRAAVREAIFVEVIPCEPQPLSGPHPR